MMPGHPFLSLRLARGFSLVELVIAIVVLSIATGVVVSMQGGIFRGQTDNLDMMVGAQLMQDCADRVLTKRRRGTNGYASVVNSSTCDGMTGLGGFSAPNVSVTDVIGSGGLCPTGAQCKQVAISVSKTGVSLGPVSLQLVNYLLAP